MRQPEIPRLAKPSIPERGPKRREVPYVPAIPKRSPRPVEPAPAPTREPVKKPGAPVPV